MNPSEQLWRQAILPANATIGQAIRNLNKIAIKIVLVADETGVLEGTISEAIYGADYLKGSI